jgi:hypothetical protein
LVLLQETLFFISFNSILIQKLNREAKRLKGKKSQANRRNLLYREIVLEKIDLVVTIEYPLFVADPSILGSNGSSSSKIIIKG